MQADQCIGHLDSDLNGRLASPFHRLKAHDAIQIPPARLAPAGLPRPRSSRHSRSGARPTARQDADPASRRRTADPLCDSHHARCRQHALRRPCDDRYRHPEADLDDHAQCRRHDHFQRRPRRRREGGRGARQGQGNRDAHLPGGAETRQGEARARLCGHHQPPGQRLLRARLQGHGRQGCPRAVYPVRAGRCASPVPELGRAGL